MMFPDRLSENLGVNAQRFIFAVMYSADSYVLGKELHDIETMACLAR